MVAILIVALILLAFTAISAEASSLTTPVGILALILALILSLILALILSLIFVCMQGLISLTSLILDIFRKPRYDLINGSVDIKINSFKVQYSLLLNL